jgi:flagellar biosynthesis protein FlhA
VEGRLREEASFKGYTVVDAPTVLSTHLTEVLKSNVGDLLSYAEVQKLIKELPTEQQELVKDIVPTQITYTGVQRVLQHLLAERVSIRDLSTILEGIAEAAGPGRNPQMVAEHVRSRLARQISASYLNANNQLPLIALSPAWEQIFLDAIIGQGDERQLALAPSKLTEFVQLIRDRFEDAARQGEIPVLLTSATVRPFVRTIVERFRSATPVLSQNEIPPRIKLKTVGSI